MITDLCEQTPVVSAFISAGEKVNRFPNSLSLEQRVKQHKSPLSSTRGQILHQQCGVST